MAHTDMQQIDPLSAASRSRRRFLRRTLFGTAALFVAPLLPHGSLRAQTGGDTGRKLLFFSEEEYAVVSAAAARLTGYTAGDPGSKETIDRAQRADQFLSTEDPEIQDQIHLLLRVFNSPIASFFFSFKFSSFSAMDASGQDSYIEGWMTSSLGFRRTGFQALKRLSMSMHYTDERSWPEIGFHGMEVPGGAR
ncbi:MAG TPA: hypothetical protein VMF59_10985 [Bacteroidota bacterium]|nr:hypothetical protein [Bacteroidota bacterium]